MAEDTPSSFDSVPAAQKDTPQSDEISNSAPSAPSDFLTHLPPSANKAFGDADTADDGPVPLESAGENAQSGQSGGSAKVQVDAHGRTLNPRSCVTCRKRKVKCDKVHPCSNCNRAHIECVFPAPGRAPRKVRKLGEGRDKELMERLRRLEGVVKGMGVEVPGKEIAGKGADVPAGKEGDREVSLDEQQEDEGVSRESGSGNNRAQSFHDVEHEDKTRWVEESNKGRFETRFGRLVVNEGKIKVHQQLLLGQPEQ